MRDAVEMNSKGVLINVPENVNDKIHMYQSYICGVIMMKLTPSRHQGSF